VIATQRCGVNQGGVARVQERPRAENLLARGEATEYRGSLERRKEGSPIIRWIGWTAYPRCLKSARAAYRVPYTKLPARLQTPAYLFLRLKKNATGVARPCKHGGVLCPTPRDLGHEPIVEHPKTQGPTRDVVATSFRYGATHLTIVVIAPTT